MKTLNKIRWIINLPFKILFYPIRLFCFPFCLILGFLQTDWEDDWDKKYYFTMLKWCVNPFKKLL